MDRVTPFEFVTTALAVTGMPSISRTVARPPLFLCCCLCLCVPRSRCLCVFCIFCVFCVVCVFRIFRIFCIFRVVCVFCVVCIFRVCPRRIYSTTGFFNPSRIEMSHANVNDFLSSFSKRPKERPVPLSRLDREAILRHFPNAEIAPSPSAIYIRIPCEEGQILLTLKSGQELSLSQLYKCSGRTGTEMLRTIVQLAKDLRLKAVTLIDASSIYVPSKEYNRYTCMLPLAPLSILITGQSWYQRQGFMAPSDDDDNKHNERIRQVPFQRTIQDVIEEWKEAFPDSPPLSIPAAEMWKWVSDTYLKPDALPCDWRVAFLRELLERAPLQYTVKRSLTIQSGGKSKSKSKKTQKRNKQNRTQKKHRRQ